jgi:hypothetical protein
MNFKRIYERSTDSILSDIDFVDKYSVFDAAQKEIRPGMKAKDYDKLSKDLVTRWSDTGSKDVTDPINKIVGRLHQRMQRNFESVGIATWQGFSRSELDAIIEGLSILLHMPGNDGSYGGYSINDIIGKVKEKQNKM